MFDSAFGMPSTHIARHFAHACEALFLFAREGPVGVDESRMESFNILFVELDVTSLPIMMVETGAIRECANASF